MYHPGVWLNGNFSCCDQRDKQAPGCRPTFVEKQAQKSISANGISAGAGTNIFSMYLIQKWKIFDHLALSPKGMSIVCPFRP